MDIEKMLTESTHFLTSRAGISFYKVGTCENCGADVFMDGTPWMSFPGVTLDECIIEAMMQYGMKEIKTEDPNESYYSEETDSEECCGLCG